MGERAVLWTDPKEGEAFLARQVLDFAPPPGGAGEVAAPRPLGDPYVSRLPIRFAAARFGGIRIDCSDSGTRVVANEDWIPEDRVFLGVEVERGVVLVLSERLALLLHNLEARYGELLPGFGLIGESSRIRAVRREILRLADSAAPALLRGATGTGKKAVARAIHDAGARQERPYLTVTMAEPTSVPPVGDLVSQLSGGTLVLDVAEKTPLDLQKELLEAITTPGGASQGADVRILAATGDASRRRLDDSAGPLLEQLAQDIVDVPPLERRRDDVARMVLHFLHEELGKLDARHCLTDLGAYAPPWLPVRLMARLVAYEWPRNVLQLRGVARHLAREHFEKPWIDIGSDIEVLLEGTADTSSSWEWPQADAEDAVQREPADVSEIELLSALRAHRWQAEPTAAELGITPEALFAAIEKFSERTRRHKRPRGSQ